MAVRKAFLSSTGRDLADYRNAVCKAINGLDNWKCVRMEDFGARTQPADTFDDKAVRDCDLFIGILGHCYGTIPKGRRKFSYTEMEYNAAIANDRSRLMFLAPDNFPVPANLREDEDHCRRQEAFRSRVPADDLHASFSTPHELAHAVLQAVSNWEDEERREEEKRRGQRLIDRVPAVPPVEPDGTGKRLLTYPITYIQDLFELVSGPKRFIAQRRAKGTLTIERALAFFALTTLILWLVPPVSTLFIIASDMLFITMKVMFYGLAIFFAWWLVGGTAKLLDYLPIFFYYSTIFSLLMIISNRISLGLLRIIDEGLYKDLIEAAKIGNITFGIELIKTVNPYVVFGVLFGILIIFSWFIAGWGAYRALNGASRRCSVLAAVLFLALCVPISGILSLVASALLAEAGLA